MANDLRERITTDPAVLVGKPVVRGTRIAVEFVLDLVASGWSFDQVLANYVVEPHQVGLHPLRHDPGPEHGPTWIDHREPPIGAADREQATGRASGWEQVAAAVLPRNRPAPLAELQAVAVEPALLVHEDDGVTENRWGDGSDAGRVREPHLPVAGRSPDREFAHLGPTSSQAGRRLAADRSGAKALVPRTRGPRAACHRRRGITAGARGPSAGSAGDGVECPQQVGAGRGFEPGTSVTNY